MSLATICSLDEVLSYLSSDASDVTDSDRISLIHRLSERSVRRYLGCNVVQATYTHILPQHSGKGSRLHGGDILRLPEYPVRSIISIYEDAYAYGGQASSAFDSSTRLTAGDDYFLSVNQSGLSWFGHVVRIATDWPSVGGSIRVRYTAGWSAAELDGDVTDYGLDASDIKLAVLKTIAATFNRSTQQQTAEGTVISEKIDDYYIQYDSSKSSMEDARAQVPQDGKLLLARFRRLVAG